MKSKSICDVQPHRHAVIIGFVDESDNDTTPTIAAFEQRLNELGFIKGATISVEHFGPLNGTVAVRCRDSLFALRTKDAKRILVETLDV